MADIDGETCLLICNRLAAGESLRTICSDREMPSISTVMRFCDENTEFRAQYAHARLVQGQGYADRIAELVDSDEDPAKVRVQVDALKWLACKLHPRVYGEKVAVDQHMSGSVTILAKPVLERLAEDSRYFLPDRNAPVGS